MEAGSPGVRSLVSAQLSAHSRVTDQMAGLCLQVEVELTAVSEPASVTLGQSWISCPCSAVRNEITNLWIHLGPAILRACWLEMQRFGVFG